MKNIHVISTEKYSCFVKHNISNNYKNLAGLIKTNPAYTAQHIYITHDEEIKKGDWFYNVRGNSILKAVGSLWECGYDKSLKIKIIITTDPELIKDGVQAIDDEFLEWFVKNQSCEVVEVVSNLIVTQNKPSIQHQGSKPIVVPHKIHYKIIIPKEEPKMNSLQEAILNNGAYEHEPKQETLEEADRMISKEAYEDSLNMQRASNAGYESKIAELKAEITKMYSEEEVKVIINDMTEKYCTYFGQELKEDVKLEWLNNLKRNHEIQTHK